MGRREDDGDITHPTGHGYMGWKYLTRLDMGRWNENISPDLTWLDGMKIFT